MPQDLNDIYYFAQVAQHGSFTAAARALGIPKSTVSRRVAQLEARLEVRLLHRTTRRLTLTDIGRTYLGHCEDMVAAADSADALVQHVREEPRGKITVTSPASLSQTLLSRAIPEFMNQYPKVTVDLDATSRRVDLVAESVDVAIRVRPTLEDSSLILRRFAVSEAVLVASPALIQSVGLPEQPTDLAQLPSLSLRYADGRHRLAFSRPGHQSLTVSLTPRLMTDDLWLLRNAAVAGVGIASLPAFLCHEELTAGSLQILLPEWRLPIGHIHAVYPHRRGLLPAVRRFVDFLADRLPELADEMGISHTCPPLSA